MTGSETPQDHGEDRPGLGHLLRSYWRRIAALSATSFIGGALEATFLLLLTASAFAITSGDGDAVSVRGVSISTGQAVAIGVTLVVLRVAIGLAVAQQSSTLRASVLLKTRRELGDAFLDASWAAQHGQPPGKLQELLTKFAERKMNLVQNLTSAATAGSNLVAMLATAAIVEPFGFLVTVFVLVVLVAVLRPLRKLIRRRSKAAALSGMAYATAVSETSQVGLEMHTFLVHDAIRERLDELARKHTRNVRRVNFVQGAMPVVYIGIAYLALIGGLGVVSAAQPSDVAALGAVMIILLRSLGYGQNLQVASAGLQSGIPFLDVLDDELLTLANARKHRGGDLSSDLGAIEFHSVSFSYDGKRDALSDVSAVIGPRETVGIIGPSGGGKSTFVQLLLGLREPTSGLILANGQPITDYDREFWARRVTFVPQQPRLVAGTIEDNIRFYRKWITRDDVERACRLANLQPDIDEMPLGLDTNVGEQGSRLSGGQQQRLVIARALTESPELLVLDEPTSALDVKSEHLIRQTMSELGKMTSIVIVAHRLSTLDVCDRIMVIRDGHLIDFDTPQALLSQSDFYKEVLELSRNFGSN